MAATISQHEEDGARRKRLDENGTIHYLGPFEKSLGNGRDMAQVVTKHYQASLGAAKRLLAIRRNGEIRYVGTDHLGSTTRVVDGEFLPVDQMRYLPYGEGRDEGAAIGTDHLYTSQILDRWIGLYWYGSRAYDAALGRFVSPDTIVPEPGNPQALNRYSYCQNNPLRFTDSTGHYLDNDWTAVGASFYNRHGEVWVDPKGEGNSPERYWKQDDGSGRWKYIDRVRGTVATFNQLPVADPQAGPTTTASPSPGIDAPPAAETAVGQNLELLAEGPTDKLVGEPSDVEFKYQKLPGRHNSVYRLMPKDPGKLLLQRGLRGTLSGSGAAGVAQAASDLLFEPDLSFEERAGRAAIATLVAVPIAAGTAVALAAGILPVVAVGAGFFAGAIVDMTVKPAVFDRLGVGDHQ